MVILSPGGVPPERRNFMIDTHCHILPQLDDGPSQWSEALAMAGQLADQGFTGVMATPHLMEGVFTLEPQLLRAKIDELNRACSEKQIPLTFYPGGEILAAHKFIADSRAFLPTFNGSRYLLLEIPLTQPVPLFFEDLLFNLNLRGYRLVLAHPERCYAFLQDPDKLLMLRKYQLLYQVNLGSFCGHFGPQSRRLAFRLLRENLISLLGTDAHRAGDERILLVSSALQAIITEVGKEAAERLLSVNPGKILENEFLEPPAAENGLLRKKSTSFPSFSLKKIFRRKGNT